MNCRFVDIHLSGSVIQAPKMFNGGTSQDVSGFYEVPNSAAGALQMLPGSFSSVPVAVHGALGGFRGVRGMFHGVS